MRSQIQVRTGCPSCGPIVVDGRCFGCEIDPGPVSNCFEPHSGAGITWDELLDFKIALDRSPWPQLELSI